MGTKSARMALWNAGVNPEDIDLIVYCSAGFYDYRFWSPAAKIQAAIGADNAYAFELKNACNGGNLGLNVCKNLLLGDPDLEYALVVCADKFSINIDYKDTDSLSVFIAGDGTATARIRKCEPGIGSSDTLRSRMAPLWTL